VAHDLPDGWQEKIKAFVDYMPKRPKRKFDKVVIKNVYFRQGRRIGVYTAEEAIEWGITVQDSRYGL